MARRKENSIRAMQAALIGGVATIIGAIITIMPKDDKQSLLQPTITIKNNNNIDLSKPEDKQIAKPENKLQSNNLTVPLGDKNGKNEKYKRIQPRIKTTPSDEISAYNLTIPKSTTNTEFDSKTKKNCGFVRSDNDADVAFYQDPTDNIQPKGYINSGSEVTILRFSIDSKMMKIQIGSRYGWIPVEKISLCN